MTFFVLSLSSCSCFRPPLIQATLDQDWQEVFVLVEEKQDVNITNSQGKTPLMLMIETADFSSAKIENKNSKAEMLSKAFQIMSDKEAYLEYDAMNRLLEAGADINLADKKGKTALMTASEKGYYLIVSVLLEAGANKNMTDKKGKTALMYATDKNVIDLLQESK